MCYAAVDPCVSTDNTNRRKQYNNIHGLDKQNYTIFWQQKRIRGIKVKRQNISNQNVFKIINFLYILLNYVLSLVNL
jgi:hypothetical protein